MLSIHLTTIVRQHLRVVVVLDGEHVLVTSRIVDIQCTLHVVVTAELGVRYWLLVNVTRVCVAAK